VCDISCDICEAQAGVARVSINNQLSSMLGFQVTIENR
jgi:hypothetical protein